ncbi:dynamin-related protein 4C-like [Humulus lupulus]|uniref:dynamin-related protein 4C-like n=1 Tax=Humulus lupulus TaxID=3486 RepID=UPI002B40EF89|nr:dynamin-related protein 4C-like [Humulus lupulus]
MGDETQNHDLGHHDDETGLYKKIEFDDQNELPLIAPIFSSYNDQIRPVLNAIDRLRQLDVTKEGIELPTIVVVGDQSSGKSSVLESLARISLPRGQGICTRVPLIMRLQNHTSSHPEIYLEYKNGDVIPVEEDKISEAINLATRDIAGDGKGISKTPLTLVVKKKGVPDLTMVDLPGITRVPVQGQPQDIYDQIKDIIMEYIQPEASIILNVLSATVDFPTCESIRMSQSVDRTGERTLAVVTKCDRAPEGLVEKVTADDVNIGLGYVCVRNRVGDESYEGARYEEAKFFQTHPDLSKMDKSIVGIPVLAKKLMQIQAKIIARNFPEIVKKIQDKLNQNLAEFSKLPKEMNSVAEAIDTFRRIIGLIKESLKEILLRGEYDDYPDEEMMHCKARLAEMLNDFSDELVNSPESDRTRNFLMDEIKHLKKANEISLPNFLPRKAFLTLLQEKVKRVSIVPIAFVGKLWDYIEKVVMAVFISHVEDYHQLQFITRRAGLNLIEKMKERSMKWVMEALEMEKLTDYTCNPEFETEWNMFMDRKDSFIYDINYYKLTEVAPSAVAAESPREYTEDAIYTIHNKYKAQTDSCTEDTINIIGFGLVKVGNAKKFPHLLHQAYDLRMRMVAYWRIVLRRLVESMALHMQQSVHKLVIEELEKELECELIASYNGDGLERLIKESPSVTTKRVKLAASIKKLKECKEILATILDRISIPDCDQ